MRFYPKKNGFFAFESALRFYSSVSTDSSRGISEWNRPALWKDDYRGLANDIFCFAEDLFGGQFCVSDRGVCTFSPETGDIEVIGSTIEEWAAAILKDYNVLTGYPLAHAWQADNRPLKDRERLIPRIPFVTGGTFRVANMVALDSVRVMKNLGNLARQIHGLPDGAKIQFEIR